MNIKILKYLLQIFGVLIFLVIITKAHFNIYGLLLTEYEKRQESLYGDCDKHGFGFSKKIYSKYNFDKNIKIVNEGDYASIGSLFYNPNKKYDLNYQIYINSKKKFKDYEIIENYENCYLVKSK